MESIKKGREGREKFGSFKGKKMKDTPSSSTNREKARNKPIMMALQYVHLPYLHMVQRLTQIARAGLSTRRRLHCVTSKSRYVLLSTSARSKRGNRHAGYLVQYTLGHMLHACILLMQGICTSCLTIKLNSHSQRPQRRPAPAYTWLQSNTNEQRATLIRLFSSLCTTRPTPILRARSPTRRCCYPGLHCSCLPADCSCLSIEVSWRCQM